jgi:hypothetical protein
MTSTHPDGQPLEELGFALAQASAHTSPGRLRDHVLEPAISARPPCVAAGTAPPSPN